MAITIVCSGCRASYAVDESLVGRKIRCRKCEAVVVVAEAKPKAPPRPKTPPPDEEEQQVTRRPAPSGKRPSQPAAPTPRRRPDDDDDYEDEEDQPRRKPKKKEKKAGGLLVTVAILGGALGLVLIVGLGITVFALMPPSEPTRAIVPMPPQFAFNQGFNDPPVNLPPLNNPPLDLPPNNDALPNNPIVVNPPPDDPPVNPKGPQNPPPDVPPPTGGGQLDQAVLKRVKRATVLLRVTLPNGSGVTGSGFFGVKPGTILTNAHVMGMLDPDSRRPSKIDVVLNSGEANEVTFPATVSGVDRSSDLAVLQTSNVKGLPEPLEVKSATDLVETQKVYVFGFPFGESLGKGITVSESSVSSLRKENGHMVKVQVNGGMHPGNSGGPVVNTRGEVIGVAVSVIRGSQINFAVPGDFVHTILNGRISVMGTQQAYFGDGEALTLPVTVVMIDPLGGIKEVALDVWTGDPGQSRPPTPTKPEEKAGDSPHQRIVLTYKSGEAKADVLLPNLPNGKVWWFQPNWVNGAGETQWVTGAQWKLPSPPVERKPATLTLNQQQATRRVVVESKMTTRLRTDEGANFALTLANTADLQETIGNVGPAGADVQYAIARLDPHFLVNDQEEKLPRDAQVLNQEARQVAFASRLDAAGSYSNRRLNMGRVAPDSRDFLESMISQIQVSLESQSVPLPGHQVQPGEKWSAQREVPIGSISSFEVGSLDMTYTYVGSRSRNNRDEAMVALDGILRGKKGQETRMGGKASGTALIDLATGQMILAQLTVRVDMDTTFMRGPAKSIGTLDVKVTRVLP